jgi:hypothetical protein
MIVIPTHKGLENELISKHLFDCQKEKQNKINMPLSWPKKSYIRILWIEKWLGGDNSTHGGHIFSNRDLLSVILVDIFFIYVTVKKNIFNCNFDLLYLLFCKVGLSILKYDNFGLSIRIFNYKLMIDVIRFKRCDTGPDDEKIPTTIKL